MVAQDLLAEVQLELPLPWRAVVLLGDDVPDCGPSSLWLIFKELLVPPSLITAWQCLQRTGRLSHFYLCSSFWRFNG